MDQTLYIPDQLPLNQAVSRTTHLTIGAHQDDIELLGYHGISACFQRSDRWFSGIVVTDGRGSPRSGDYADYTDEEMAMVRAQEQATAADIGQYGSLLSLNQTSAQVKNTPDALASHLFEFLMQAQPQQVYLHNPFDHHDTHLAVWLASMRALQNLPEGRRPLKVWSVEVWGGLDWLPATEREALDVSQRPHLRRALLGIYDSQIAGGKRYDDAAMARSLANATFADSHQTDATSAISWAQDVTELMALPLPLLQSWLDQRWLMARGQWLQRLQTFSERLQESE